MPKMDSENCENAGIAPKLPTKNSVKVSQKKYSEVILPKYSWPNKYKNLKTKSLNPCKLALECQNGL